MLKAPAQIKVQFVDVTKEAGLPVSLQRPTRDLCPASSDLAHVSSITTMMDESTFSLRTTARKAALRFTTTWETESLKT